MDRYDLNRVRIPVRTMLHDYLEALNRFTAWGIEIPRSSRWVRCIRRFQDALTHPLGFTMSPTDAYQMRFDYREMDEAIAIARSFPLGPGKAARSKIREMVSGSAHPAEESTSVGRDAQWELYLRALLRSGGLASGFGNPDLLVRMGGRTVPIEAKRPKREERLDDRLRRGVSQLEASGHEGVVAFSLDLALPLGEDPISAPTEQMVEYLVASMLDDLVNRNLDRMLTRVKDRPVLGVFFFARIPTQVESGLTHLVSFGRLEEVNPSPHREAVFDRILKAMHRAQC